MSKNHTQETLDAVFSSGELHHAYLLEGGPTLVASLRQHIEDTYSITTKNNPDFHHLHVDTFTIDDARRLAEAQATRALGSTLKKFFIIEAASVTIEAQNALLKILEEPTAGTHFFFILPSRWLMLPTVLSRLQVVGTGIAGSTTASSPISAKVFLAAAPAERLTMIKTILDEKDTGAAMAFVDSLIEHIHRGDAPQKHTLLTELLSVRQYLGDRAASLKLILEHLALSIPPLI